MIQNRPYEFMVYYTPQKEWVEKGGVKLWLAFFFIELGAGTFFIASFFENLWAMFVGWLVCLILGSGLHFLYLGKPFRFWRIVISSGWQTSWISRGLIFIAFFLTLGIAHISLNFWADANSGLLIVTDLFAFLTIIYGGFAMNYVNGIPLWNTALLPVLYVISGLWGGAEVTLGILLLGGSSGANSDIEVWIRILLMGFIFLMFVYLVSIGYSSVTGRASISYLLRKWSVLFWLGLVLIGIVIPLCATIVSFFTDFQEIPLVILGIAIICGLIGDLSMRYLILRCGLYSPLIPSSVNMSAIPPTKKQ